jgi:hypothetical protein
MKAGALFVGIAALLGAKFRVANAFKAISSMISPSFFEGLIFLAVVFDYVYSFQENYFEIGRTGIPACFV